MYLCSSKLHVSLSMFFKTFVSTQISRVTSIRIIDFKQCVWTTNHPLTVNEKALYLKFVLMSTYGELPLTANTRFECSLTSKENIDFGDVGNFVLSSPFIDHLKTFGSVPAVSIKSSSNLITCAQDFGVDRTAVAVFERKCHTDEWAAPPQT